MKHSFKLLILVISLMLILTGCGKSSNNNTKKEDSSKGEHILNCTFHTKDVVNNYELDDKYTIYYTDGLVEKAVIVERVTSTDDEVLKSLKETVDETYKAYNENYGGCTYNAVKEAGVITFNTTMDYSKMNLNQYVIDNPILKSFLKDDRLTIEGVKMIYTTIGATCEE